MQFSFHSQFIPLDELIHGYVLFIKNNVKRKNKGPSAIEMEREHR